MEDQRLRCGFVGLGDQGAPIARRMIDAGFDVLLWARRPETLEPFRGGGGRFAGSLADLGAQAEHVGICVLDDAGVIEVCDALIPVMARGARLAIHSTVHPATVEAVAARAAARGVAVIDAPVSGGAQVATAGGLTVMIGGDEAAVETALPVFRTFGERLIRLGGVGAGQHAKVINNSLLAANIALAGSALRLGERLGVARDALLDVLLSSTGRSFGLEVVGRMTDLRTFKHGGMVLEKDVAILRQLFAPDLPDASRLGDAASPFLEAVRLS